MLWNMFVVPSQLCLKSGPSADWIIALKRKHTSRRRKTLSKISQTENEQQNMINKRVETVANICKQTTRNSSKEIRLTHRNAKWLAQEKHKVTLV